MFGSFIIIYHLKGYNSSLWFKGKADIHKMAYRIGSTSSRRPRENYRDSYIPGNWSEWIEIMSPIPQGMFVERDGPGYRNTNVRRYIKENCGIYELALGKSRYERVAVYLGSTCRSENMFARINEYCRNGSHKSEIIDEALNQGYTIYVRYRQSDPVEETSLLRMEYTEQRWHANLLAVNLI
ncbi:uncharacterized protein LOC128556398 [Mercenaria mercenaria]|uniref:uncharacterized protein LOC128556398 n=1 Tax=Mercenaria mercenaria TaxID=6596 RepID=UPI00234E9563|nr:uncharacterized protein LOC128556398 [Mercenaria mercenaria]